MCCHLQLMKYSMDRCTAVVVRGGSPAVVVRCDAPAVIVRGDAPAVIDVV